MKILKYDFRAYTVNNFYLCVCQCWYNVLDILWISFIYLCFATNRFFILVFISNIDKLKSINTINFSVHSKLKFVEKTQHTKKQIQSKSVLEGFIFILSSILVSKLLYNSKCPSEMIIGRNVIFLASI